MKPAIAIERVSKEYRLGSRLGDGDYRTLRDTVGAVMANSWNGVRNALSGKARTVHRAKPSTENDKLWALDDVSFEVKPGEVIGIIGRNGAGKSTLLKILSRITEPTSGRAVMHGRVGSLLEVGTGFHHELTGRENIYLNGAILGMGRHEIARKFDAIVAFAGVEAFLNTPVKRYSSGMFVRLAFAVASHLETEILIVDEVLAVGDMAFQKKCLGKMDEVRRSGRTVLFVSHNMSTILHLCEKVAYLEHGRLAFLGDCAKGVAHYMQSCSAQGASEIDFANHPNRRRGSSAILSRLRLLNGEGVATEQLLGGEPLTIEVEFVPDSVQGDTHIGIGFEDSMGRRLFTVATYLSNAVPCLSNPRRLCCRLDQLPLAPGRYCLTVNAGPRQGAWTDVVEQALWFDVTAADFYGNGKMPNPEWGSFLVRSQWTLTPELP